MKTISLPRSLSVAVMALTLSFSSCTNFGTRSQNSAATGALIGAGAGALISDNAVSGALVGGALGGGAGYLYGRSR